LRRNRLKLIITCEHAAPAVPARYRSHFTGRMHLLTTHRGWDIGALNLAEVFSRSLRSPLIRSEVSRLLVDLNRSTGHPGLFSRAARPLDEDEKNRILNRYYFPYRKRVETAIRNSIGTGRRVLHLSVHTFTPVMNGKIRGTAIGLLFDPGRKREREFCERWRRGIREANASWPVHFNLPYRGKTDGLTSAMRSLWGEDLYRGIELEINQKFFSGKQYRGWRRMAEAVAGALRGAISESQLPQALQ
jgi:predicted N-formylglutamate amidohydrolase